MLLFHKPYSDYKLTIQILSLNELPERCRTIFIKVREEKQSYASVAEELNISPKTVDAQLQKAVTRLKEKINNYFRNRR